MTPLRIAAIVLAAGSSSRMGTRNKLLEKIDGETLIKRVARALKDSGIDSVYIVTGHQNDQIEESLAGMDQNFVFNEKHEEGMGTSIASGTDSIEDARFDGIALCLGDLGMLNVKSVKKVINKFEDSAGRKIVAPSYQGKRGHPVIFPINYLAHLRGLTGDSGAKTLLAQAGKTLEIVELNDQSVIQDFDTLDDFPPK